MKILLIDDEQALLKVFTETLETLGHFTVVTAETGNTGIEKVRTEQPDLILLDQVLPDINGNQILQMIKQDPSTKNIPVAMLSNFNQDNLVQDAINLGALDYILKYQVEPEDLVAKVNKLIKENVKPPAIENDIPLSPTPASTANTPITPPVPQPVIPTAPTPMPQAQSPMPTTAPAVIPVAPKSDPAMPSIPEPKIEPKDPMPMPPLPQQEPIASSKPEVSNPLPTETPTPEQKIVN